MHRAGCGSVLAVAWRAASRAGHDARVPDAAQRERSEAVRCRSGTVPGSEFGTVPRCDAPRWLWKRPRCGLLYFKSFRRTRPEVVMSVEEWARARQAKKAA